MNNVYKLTPENYSNLRYIFNSENLFLEMVRVYSNNQNQIKDFTNAMVLLGENDQPPNVRAANSIIRFYKDFKTVQ